VITSPLPHPRHPKRRSSYPKCTLTLQLGALMRIRMITTALCAHLTRATTPTALALHVVRADIVLRHLLLLNVTYIQLLGVLPGGYSQLGRFVCSQSGSWLSELEGSVGALTGKLRVVVEGVLRSGLDLRGRGVVVSKRELNVTGEWDVQRLVETQYATKKPVVCTQCYTHTAGNAMADHPAPTAHSGANPRNANA
jgi:hypothetical protein